MILLKYPLYKVKISLDLCCLNNSLLEISNNENDVSIASTTVLTENTESQETTKSSTELVKELKKGVYNFSNRWTLRKRKKLSSTLHQKHLIEREVEKEVAEWSPFQSLEENEMFLDEENNNIVAGSVSMDFRKIYNNNR